MLLWLVQLWNPGAVPRSKLDVIGLRRLAALYLDFFIAICRRSRQFWDVLDAGNAVHDLLIGCHLVVVGIKRYVVVRDGLVLRRSDQD